MYVIRVYTIFILYYDILQFFLISPNSVVPYYLYIIPQYTPYFPLITPYTVHTPDALLRTPLRKIPKEDVAEVLIQALIWKEAIGRSIDIGSLPPGEGNGPTKDWLRFWARPGNCAYPADYEEEGAD